MTETTDPTTPAANDPTVDHPAAATSGVEAIPSDPAAPSDVDTGGSADTAAPDGPDRTALEAENASLRQQLAAALAAAATAAATPPAPSSAPAAADPSQPAPPVPVPPGPSSSAPDASPVPPAPASAPPTDPASAADDVPANEQPTPSEWQGKAGSVVRHTYFDPYRGAGGEEVTVSGIVTGVEGATARVAWFLEVSDPIALDELDVAD